ncbi:MAG: histidine kinase [Rhodoglobus sp.]|nr:histidine kinase [Rhodoglobus sp.]
MAARATTIPAVPQGKQPRNPISRKQVENVISRSVAVFGIVFGAQTIPWLLGQLDEAYPLWLWIVVPALFGTLVVVLVLSFAKVWVRQAHGAFAIIYLVSLVSWPFTILPGAAIYPGPHWLYYLVTVATAMAAIGFNTLFGTVYLFLAPLIYLVVRASPVAGEAGWQLATLEAVYSIILGGAVMIIVTMLRQAASSVDAAQATALDRYGHAVRQHATEVERVQVDSIVHDSVLTTLLSAARAETPAQKTLAAQMASNAMRHLREAALVSPDDGTTVRFRQLADRIVTAARQMPVPFAVRVRSLDTRVIPSAQAEALYSAAVQAMMNSVQHAGGPDVRRWLKVAGVHGGAVEIEVGDAGVGFDPAAVPDERLGVRRSIVERTANAGGHAEVRAAIGRGSVVVLSWPVFVEGEARDDDTALHERGEA